MNVCKIAAWMINIVDSDQTPHSAAFDLGLHCLLRSVCLSVRICRLSTIICTQACVSVYLDYFGYIIKSNPSEILLDPPLMTSTTAHRTERSKTLELSREITTGWWWWCVCGGGGGRGGGGLKQLSEHFINVYNLALHQN